MTEPRKGEILRSLFWIVLLVLLAIFEERSDPKQSMTRRVREWKEGGLKIGRDWHWRVRAGRRWPELTKEGAKKLRALRAQTKRNRSANIARGKNRKVQRG